MLLSRSGQRCAVHRTGSPCDENIAGHLWRIPLRASGLKLWSALARSLAPVILEPCPQVLVESPDAVVGEVKDVIDLT